jgi:hypothetical protein
MQATLKFLILLIPGWWIASLSAQHLYPSVALTASRFSGKTSGERMHHPGLEVAMVSGKRKLHPMLRFQTGRISGEEAWDPMRTIRPSGFVTNYRSVSAGLNFMPLTGKIFYPQIRFLLQVLNYQIRDFSGNTSISERSLTPGYSAGLGITWRVDTDFSLFVFWEYQGVSSDITGMRNITGKKGFSQMGIGMIGGR